MLYQICYQSKQIKGLFRMTGYDKIPFLGNLQRITFPLVEKDAFSSLSFSFFHLILLFLRKTYNASQKHESSLYP